MKNEVFDIKTSKKNGGKAKYDSFYPKIASCSKKLAKTLDFGTVMCYNVTYFDWEEKINVQIRIFKGLDGES